MLRIKKYLMKEKGLGLVEALIALGVVGTGMVVITYLSMKTIRLARKNELQDVAVQAGVEAMDFLKDPVPLDATMPPHWNVTDSGGHYYNLDMTTNPPRIVGALYPPDEIQDCEAATYDVYGVSTLPDYVVCQQIKVESAGGSDTKFNIDVIVVWQTIGGGYEKKVLQGYRLGKFNRV